MTDIISEFIKNPAVLLIFSSLNLATFITAGYDKHAARHHKWRVPEKTLFLLATLGGSIGLYIAMLVLRHKTKHWYFMLGVPVLIIAQAAVIVSFW